MALVGRRAYWDDPGGGYGTFDDNLLTESSGGRGSREIDFESQGTPGTDTLVAASSDGTGVYVQSSPGDGTPGPIRRWVGLHPRRVTNTIPWLSALAAAETRFAYASSDGDCADSPAWSAANGEIAFSRASDPFYAGTACPGGIWVMNSDGTGLRQIAAVGANPEWSPDGTKIAFDNGRQVIVANSDGSNPHTLFAGMDPAWSPDGSQIAFDMDGALYVANTDGSGLHEISTSGLAPTWSPAGTQIAFSQPSGKGQGLGIVNADGTGYHQLLPAHTAHGTFHDAAPAWSPNGVTIAFEDGNGEIRAVAPDGTHEQVLTRNANYLWAAFAAPAWSPDSRLVFTAEVCTESGCAPQTSEHREDYLGDANLVTQPNGSPHWKALTQPPSASSVVLESRRGATLGQFQVSGRVTALAVSKTTVAALIVDHSNSRIQIFLPHPRTVVLARRPSDDLAGGTAPLPTSGNTIIYHVRNAIYALDSRHGRPHLIAHASSRPIGLSIVGRRVAWAESGKRARIRAITLP
jgi:Tol biopolymer transport system component